MRPGTRSALARSAAFAGAVAVAAAALGVGAGFASAAESTRRRAMVAGLLESRKSRLAPEAADPRGPRDRIATAFFPLRDSAREGPVAGAGGVALLPLAEGDWPAVVLVDASGSLVAVELLPGAPSGVAGAIAAAMDRRSGARPDDGLAEESIGPGAAELALDSVERIYSELLAAATAEGEVDR